MNDVRSQVGLFNSESSRTKGVLQMRTSTLFGAKKRIFRNLWCVRTTRERGV